MRYGALIVAILLLSSCGKRTKSTSTRPVGTTSESQRPADAPRLEPRPELRRDVVETRAERDLVVIARMLVRTLGPKDAVRIELAFKTSSGPLSETAGLGKEKISYSELLGGLAVTVKPPKGDAVKLVTTRNAAPPSGTNPFAWMNGRVLHVSSEGVEEPPYKLRATWTEPSGALFANPGRYTLKLAGSLALESGPLTFETGELEIDVKEAAGLKPLGEIETAAAAYLQQHWKLKSAPRPVQATMEDAKGQRVVRFSVDDSDGETGYGMLDYAELVMGQSGDVLSLASEHVFRCIAEGTAVATPEGPRRVETLARGDSVLGYDVDSGRRVTTHVVDISMAHGEELIALTEGLTVSGRHPVYADGSWTEARDVRRNAVLLSLDGRAVAATPRAPSGDGTVYDLSVAWPHTYFAGGVLVHNKAAESPAARSIRTDLDHRPKPR
jgi:hypothetical protein